MLKPFYMAKPKSLINVFWMSMTSLYLILVCILVYLWVGEELKKTQTQIDNLRETYINTQQEIIKTQVKHSVAYIRHQKSLAEKKVKQEVKFRTNEAYNTALYISIGKTKIFKNF